MMLRSEIAHQYGDNHWSACQSELNRLRQSWNDERNMGEHTAEGYAYKDRNKVTVGGAIVALRHFRVGVCQCVFCANDGQYVTSLQHEVRNGNIVDTVAGYFRHVCPKARPDIEFLNGLAV